MANWWLKITIGFAFYIASKNQIIERKTKKVFSESLEELSDDLVWKTFKIKCQVRLTFSIGIHQIDKLI